MKLTLGSTLFPLVSTLIGISHGLPQDMPPPHLDKRMLRSLQPGLPRNITMITDLSYDDRVFSPVIQGLVFPSHTWLIFHGTAKETPLRVEIVCPTARGVPRGLAIAVTDHTRARLDEGERSPGSLPRSSTRYTVRLPRTTTLTNDQIFDPSHASGETGRSPSLVEKFWTDNARGEFRIDDAARSAGNFGTSHELAMNMLLAPPLEFSRAQFNEVWAAINIGQQWAAVKRKEAGRPESSEKRIDYLYYEAIAPLTPQQGRSKFRALFGVERRPEDGEVVGTRQVYGKLMASPLARRPGGAGAGGTSADGRFFDMTGDRGTTVLSRDPRLTSDVLPLGEKGSLADVCSGAQSAAECDMRLAGN